MDGKQFDELMKARHSVRYFQNKEIPENTLKMIITTALQLLLGVIVKHGIFMLPQEKLHLK